MDKEQGLDQLRNALAEMERERDEARAEAAKLRHEWCDGTVFTWEGADHAGQHEPTPNDSRPVWELVIEDMRARDHLGRERYGTPLQAHNGRDALQDAYEEALDLSVYLRQAIEEREG